MASSVLFAGGGTGGHIYPNVAIVERLREHLDEHDAQIHFLVSDRPGDAATMDKLGERYTQSPVQPLPSARAPWKAVTFLGAWHRAVRQAQDLLVRERVTAVVATGGFVSGPAVVAARRLDVPRVLVNLDAIPGKANRRLARLCTKVFSTYATPVLPEAERIGLPLRQVSVLSSEVAAAKRRLDLDPDRKVLFVTGATHGAESIIRTMMKLVAEPDHARLFDDWQIFHQCGTFDVQTLARAYDEAGVRHTVVAYCDAMGAAWGSADLVISRAGAGSVAEAWANAAPTIFLPNPYHKDQHQRHNAQPLVDAGGALILTDHVEPELNVERLGPALFDVMADDARRARMKTALEESRPPDGATVVATWIGKIAGPRPTPASARE
jgi:UDP-N-acetylglucosamine--N-acetylmuramyl-(pentapeptide) pyrophosphoryl-undecaprenol N-acetylglucosamine transferase